MDDDWSLGDWSLCDWSLICEPTGPIFVGGIACITVDAATAVLELQGCGT